MVIKALHVLCVLLLLLVVYLQLNDPDPLLWVLFYGYCAVPAALALMGKKSVVVNVSALLFGAVWLVISAGGVFEYLQHMHDVSLLHGMSTDKPYIEETREFLGVLMTVFVVALYQLLYKPVQ